MAATCGFFVGIGAQRAGTTWLSTMFDDHPEIGMSPVKETHFWSSKYVAHQRNSVRGLQALKLRIPKLLNACLRQPARAPAWLFAYAGMMAHRDRSYRRFIELGRGESRIAGEITPAYATLPTDAFQALDACLDQPKYVYILRNPADRLISQIAHTEKQDPSVLTASVTELLDRPYFAMRSSYRSTYETCREVVGEDRLFVLFFEDLFEPERAQETFDAVCAFLGVSPMPTNTGEIVNARPKPKHGLSRPDLVEALKDDYLFARDRIAPALPPSWTDDLSLLSPKDAR